MTALQHPARSVRRSGTRRRLASGRVAGGDASERQGGASMAEFLAVAPVLLFLGLGTVQAGLIYHGNTILNYATFEAARTGATRHALPEPMRRELAIRLAPLVGGDGSDVSAMFAIARSIGDIDMTIGSNGQPKPVTRIDVLNPTPAAFEEWGVVDPVVGRTVIPNSHLRHRHVERAAGASGTTLRDANLLKIEVTHGLELRVPLVGRFLTSALALVDPDNRHWYSANRLPLTSVATVRMQSDAWREEETTGTVTVGIADTEDADSADDASSGADAADDTYDDVTNPIGDTDADMDADACGATGLGTGGLLVDESAYADGRCAAGSGDYHPAGLPAILGAGDGSDLGASDPILASPVC